MTQFELVLFWIALVVIPIAILLAAIGSICLLDATAGYLSARGSWL